MTTRTTRHAAATSAGRLNTDLAPLVALNARRIKSADRTALGVVTALLLGIFGALLLVHYLTPCDAGTLCMAAAIVHTRTGPLAWVQRQLFRARAACRAWYLRRLVNAAENDIDHMTAQLDWLPHQINYHHIALDALRLQLVSAEIDARGQ